MAPARSPISTTAPRSRVTGPRAGKTSATPVGSRPRRRRVSEGTLLRVARRVLAWEGARDVRVELTLLGAPAMQRLNRRATGRRGLTDVVAFALPQPDGSIVGDVCICPTVAESWLTDRKSTRLNSSHGYISYAVFCLKKKKKIKK